MRAELVDSIRAAIEEAQHQADGVGREVIIVAVVSPMRGDPCCTEDSPLWEEQFLSELARTRNVTRACELAGISRPTVYRWRGKDQEFRKRWEEAAR